MVFICIFVKVGSHCIYMVFIMIQLVMVRGVVTHDLLSGPTVFVATMYCP